MSMKIASIAAGFFACCLSAGCGGPVAKREPLVASSEIPVIERAESLGAQLYAQDLYAAQATSLLLAHGLDLIDIGTLGWITESRRDGCVVTFVAGDPEQWRSVCVVTFVEDTEPNIVLIDRDLSETQSAMFNARQLSLNSIEDSCSDAFNTVVLPRDDGPGWLAYALAATSDPNLILVGGHSRVTVSVDGRTILERRRFTKDCMVLKKPEDVGPEGDIAAYTLGHVLDNTPTEIHVFLSLLYGKPLYVVTADRRFWYIDGGKIRILRHP